MRTDTKLQRAVQRELEWDARLDPVAIGVAVRNGVVTLAGTTGTWATLKAAQAAAHRAERESHRIRVDNRGGIVMLSGACRTWAGKKVVVGAGRGGLSVQDQLRIEP